MKFSFSLAILILQLMSTGISACSCFDSESVSEKYFNYDHVYLVEIAHSKTIDPNPSHNEETTFAVYLSILEVFKGSPHSELVASAFEYWHDPLEEIQLISSCAMNLTMGQSFVVFVRNGENLEINMCSRNKLYLRKGLLSQLRSLADGKEQTHHSAKTCTEKSRLTYNKSINYASGATHLWPDPLLQASLAGVGRLYQR